MALGYCSPGICNVEFHPDKQWMMLLHSRRLVNGYAGTRFGAKLPAIGQEPGPLNEKTEMDALKVVHM